jgi:hypothetical protein
LAWHGCVVHEVHAADSFGCFKTLQVGPASVTEASGVPRASVGGVIASLGGMPASAGGVPASGFGPLHVSARGTHTARWSPAVVVI